MTMLSLVAWMLASGVLLQGQPADIPPQQPPADLVRLRELLYQRDRPQEQSQAALLLVQAGTTDAQTVIREGLRRYDRPDVFQALAAAVRLWRDERLIPLLLQALGSDQLVIRQSAAETLAAQSPKVVTRWLIALAEDSSASTTSRQAAVQVLGRCMHKTAVEALLKLLLNESAAIRQAAATALQEVSGQSLGSNIVQWQNWWQPYANLSDEDWLASRAVLFADRTRRLADELQRTEAALLQTHQQLYTKIPATDRLAFVQTVAQSDFPSLRSQAVTWCSELLRESNGTDTKACADLLLQISRDGVEAIQRHAVLALEKVDDPRAFDRLLQLLQLGPPSIRAAAARSLGRFGSNKTNISGDLKKRTVLALEQALGDTSLPVVASSAESLGVLQSQESGPLLAGLLKHPDEAVRQSAAVALEQLATLNLADSLYFALDDPAASVRFNLIGALGRIGAREALSEAQRAVLIKRLSQTLSQDSDPGVRSRAATVLGDLGSPAELQLLWQRVRAKEDNRVQLRAWSAMLDIFARTQSLPLLAQWDQTFNDLAEHARRSQLYAELVNRWSRVDNASEILLAAQVGLVRSLLAERKWQQALPLATELTRKSQTDAERRERLRWLLVAGTQALEEKKAAEVLRLLKEIDELLMDAKELAPEFAELRRKAQLLLPTNPEPDTQPGGLNPPSSSTPIAHNHSATKIGEVRVCSVCGA